MYLFILAYLILFLSLFTYDERFKLPDGEVLSPNQIPSLQVDKLEAGTLPEGVKINYANIQGSPPIAAPPNLSGYAPASGSENYAPASGSANYAPASGSTIYAPASGSTIYAPASGSANYAPASGSANYAPASGSTIYATKAEATAGSGYKANDNATFGTVTCTSLTISSDRRIKKNIQPLVSLDLLRKLKPVRYQLKNGQKEVCGFIAQEIQETIPEAVSTQTGVMPNICDEATVDKDILTFSTFLTSDLSYDPEEKPYKLKVDEELVVILEVLDEHRVRIDKELVNKELVDKVYVLGQEVADFLSIDSHQIFTVATCALQELDAKVHEMDSKVHQLEEENKALLQRFNRLEQCLNLRTV